MNRPARLPEPLRAQIVEALAQLLLEDLERFPTLPDEDCVAGEEGRPA